MWNYQKKKKIYIYIYIYINRQFMPPPSRTNNYYHFVIYTWKCCFSLRNSTLQMKIITPLRTIPSLHSAFYLSKETTIMSLCIFFQPILYTFTCSHVCAYIPEWHTVLFYTLCVHKWHYTTYAILKFAFFIQDLHSIHVIISRYSYAFYILQIIPGHKNTPFC